MYERNVGAESRRQRGVIFPILPPIKMIYHDICKVYAARVNELFYVACVSLMFRSGF
jgi:hypothetical protein